MPTRADHLTQALNAIDDEFVERVREAAAASGNVGALLEVVAYIAEPALQAVLTGAEIEDRFAVICGYDGNAINTVETVAALEEIAISADPNPDWVTVVNLDTGATADMRIGWSLPDMHRLG